MKIFNSVAFAASMLIVGMLAGCSEVKTSYKGAIIPHHLLVEKYIEYFYLELGSEDIEHVILLSPNHFNYGHHYMQTTDVPLGTSDNAPRLDIDFIEEIVKNSRLKVEPSDFGKEHGVTAHLDFIARHFPNAELTPIILKASTPQQQLDDLVDTVTTVINAKGAKNQTFIIASIDFSHYESEEISLKNDHRTEQWLEYWAEEILASGNYDEDYFADVLALGKSTSNSEEVIVSGIIDEYPVAMDSPQTLYVFTRLMEAQQSKEMELYLRTSTASLLGLEDPTQNTSHLFVSFW